MNDIYFGNCIEIMNSFNNNTVDHIICDLPYYQIVKNSWDNQWNDLQHYLDWCDNIFITYKRILKENGNLFLFTGRQYNRHICLLLDKYFIEKRIIIWVRKRNFNNTRGKALSSNYEPICYYCNGNNGIFNNIKIKIETTRKEYTEGILKDGITLSDVWSDISALPHNSKEKLSHPTQKPEKLIERIILLGTNENDIILDNCAGSGTLGVVCKKLNRNYILIENNKEYFDIIEKRIKNLK
jgi:site-specific DNA-methyltransferase (adenine-specific)